MSSDNPSGADNQQETLPSRSSSMPAGWRGSSMARGASASPSSQPPPSGRPGIGKMQPVFQVSQHSDHRAVLEALVPFFGCGSVRSKGPPQPGTDLRGQPAGGPGATDHPVLRAYVRLIVKDSDFGTFAPHRAGATVRRSTWPRAGFERLVRLAYGMNANGKQRARTLEDVLAGSSETVRQAPHGSRAGDETVRPAWRHAEQGRNSLAHQHQRLTCNKCA